MTKEFVLPQGYTTRNATLDDYLIACEMLNRYSQRVSGSNELDDPEVLKSDWQHKSFDPKEDVLFVLSPSGELVGYAESKLTAEPPVHPWSYGCVLHEHHGKGIGSYLLNWLEEHAKLALERTPAELRVAPRSGVLANNEEAIALFENEGWKHVRSFYRMRIDFTAAPEAPMVPAGIIIRKYDPSTELEAVYRAYVDSFKDHYGFVEQPLEKGFADYKHNFVDEPGYSPDFWFVAMDGNEVAGVSICRAEDMEDKESGWVFELGVRRAWRKKGLGEALLKHSFVAFYNNGSKRAALGVDASSLTGALRLYEKSGMYVARQFKMYEKELRAGKELGVEAIE
jgi:ribosomal protein S18 acetylase RimI-like enzyme